MKSFTFTFAAGMLVVSGALAAPPQGAPAAATAPTMPCPGMGSGMMGNGAGNCPAMQGRSMGPGMMQGRPMGPGRMRGGAMGSGMMGNGTGLRNGKGRATPAPGAASKSAAGRANSTVYGWQLMTPEERAAYRARLRAAKTAHERAQIRAEHHKEMEIRAKERGVTLPPGPPTR